MIRILFQSRTTLFSVPGGDTIQMIKTAEGLRKIGCEVYISTELEPDVSDYDLVHLFNLMRPQEVYLQAINAKSQGKKVALSTIYGPYIEYDKKARVGVSGVLAKATGHGQFESLKVIARAVINFEINKGTFILLRHGWKALQSKIIDMTDVLLPNSESEMKRVIKDFPESGCKQHVVIPNGVDTEIFNPDAIAISGEVEKYKDCILCVARIEGRKNQLNLVRVANDLGWPVVLIGKPAPNHLSYYEQIKKEAGPNVHIIGQVEHSLLPQFYKAAKVHVLISWMETPGLSSLEAGAMGCNLVITRKGDTCDYFGNYAFYCDPDSVNSIRDAISKAYESPINPGIREHILQNFTWEKASQKTLEGYKHALKLS